MLFVKKNNNIYAEKCLISCISSISVPNIHIHIHEKKQNIYMLTTLGKIHEPVHYICFLLIKTHIHLNIYYQSKKYMQGK